jgi:hypothetical protein
MFDRAHAGDLVERSQFLDIEEIPHLYLATLAQAQLPDSFYGVLCLVLGQRYA